MTKLPKAPGAYRDFVERFPLLGQAWDRIGEAGKDGPLDECTQRLIKLAVAIGAPRQGAVQPAVPKALAPGIPRGPLDQVVALSAGTLGMPSVVAAYNWVKETELKAE